MGEESSPPTSGNPITAPSPSTVPKEWSFGALSSKLDVQKWDTRNLGARVAVDVTAAASAGALVAPIITMIDRGIIENASGRAPLGESLKNSFKALLLRPHRFIFSKPFALIFTLYTGTYITANTIDTASSTIRGTPASTITAGPAKFFATSTSNLALCIYKDSHFTQMFGAPGQIPRPVPLPTYALFTIRDCLTIFASFNVPPLLAPYLSERFGEQLEKHVSSLSAAQFAAPAMVQLFSTPIHLLGLDLYNRQGVTWQARAAKVAREWGKSCFARIGRIVPAFGVGGVVNMRVRRDLMTRYD